ncbi:hypothetical protein MMC29_000008 [Sticta canariensis]|nr:hypothetical protein [Sticta canariensis]
MPTPVRLRSLRLQRGECLPPAKPTLIQALTAGDGSKAYDLTQGSGSAVKAGSKVKACCYIVFWSAGQPTPEQTRALAQSTDQCMLAVQPLEFVAGKLVTNGDLSKDIDQAGGLYSGIPGPKPPPVLGTAVVGMKKGGKRSVLVPPELGYGKDGLLEIPPNSKFELQIEVLSVG